MPGRFAVAIFLLGLVVPLAAAGLAVSADWPPASITVVLDDNYPPYIFRDKAGEPQGLLVDEWHLWSQATGVGVKLVATDWEKAQGIMASGGADVIDTIFENEQRAKLYDFTRPYAKLDVPVYSQKSLGGITGVESLQGFTIGVKAGDACIDVLRRNGITSIREFYSYEDIIDAAGKGEIKVFCMDKPPAVYYLYKYGLEGEFRYAFTLYTGEFHRAVKKGRADLLRLVEDGFARIDPDKMQAVERKWLGTPIYDATLWRRVAYGFAAVLGCVLVLGGFNLALRRKVRAKTRELNELLEALLKSDERWQFALEGAGAGVWDWNLATGKTFFSDRWKSMLGFEPGELEHSFEQWRELVHPDDLDRALATIDLHLAGKTPDYVLEHRLRCKDGRYKWILSMGKIMAWDKSGAPLRMIGTHNDISARKDAEDSLLRAMTFNAMILEHSPVGILAYDGGDGACVMANHVAAELLGVGLGELLGGNLREVAIWDARSPGSAAAKALAGEGVQRADFRLRDATGTGGMADCTFARIEVDGAPFLLIIAVDVAERMRMYEIMAETEKMMSVGGLAAGMAHEINNPLAGILQNAQNLERRLSAGTPANHAAAAGSGCSFTAVQGYCRARDIYTLLDAVRESGKRAARIVASMLEFSRRSGSAVEPANLGRLLDKALELCANDYDLKRNYDFRSVEIVRDYAPNMPAVPCSEIQIEQVVVNILRNAAQAMVPGRPGSPPPRIILRTRVEGGMARLDIEDNGSGMEEEVLRKAFEPFFTTKAPGAGTGLGLSVSYFIIVSTHKGNLGVVSRPGEGTTFTIRLPLERA